MFVKETFVALKTLNFKREDLGELESLVGSMITCLSDCGIAIGQRRPVIKICLKTNLRFIGDQWSGTVL